MVSSPLHPSVSWELSRWMIRAALTVSDPVETCKSGYLIFKKKTQINSVKNYYGHRQVTNTTSIMYFGSNLQCFRYTYKSYKNTIIQISCAIMLKNCHIEQILILHLFVQDPEPHWSKSGSETQELAPSSGNQIICSVSLLIMMQILVRSYIKFLWSS